MASFASQFRASVRRHPHRPCLEVDGKQYSYAEVDQLTDHLARKLGDEVLRHPVAICLPKGLEVYLAQLAVVKAGGFFVPIDPNYPEDRIAYMIEDSGAGILITNSQLPVANESITRMEVDVSALAEDVDDLNKFPAVSGDDNAYMIYTSGTTGKPKGVPIHHEALLNHNTWFVDTFSLSEDDRVLQFASLSFDISLEEIFPALLAGATLVPAPSVARESMREFLGWIEAQRITVLNLPTAYWHELTYHLTRLPIPPCVRLMIIGGEKVSADRVEAWFEAPSSLPPLYNAYGPTETTITSSVVKLHEGTEITIGSPISGLQYQVLNEALSPVEKGEVGELVISGVGVAKGYWRRPDLTRDKFISLREGRAYRTGDRVCERPEGEYEFLGRIDEQVKVNGYRIEPREVEDAMLLHSTISEAIVLPKKVGAKVELIGYFVADSGLLGISLEAHLAEKLPAYMIPDHLVALDRMPVTPGGKVDRSALPLPIPKGGGDSRLPETSTEKELHRIWQSIFAQPEIGTEVDFFALGGDSLKAIRLVAMIEQAFEGRCIPIAKLADKPTIRALAELIDRGEKRENGEHGTPLISTLNPDSEREPIFGFHGAGGGGLYCKEFEEVLSNRHPFHIFESSLLYSDEKVEIQHATVEELGALYADAVEEKLDGDKSAIHLFGYSLGGLLAYEVGKQLAERGYVIGSLINIDGANPAVVQKNSMVVKLAKLFRHVFSPPRFYSKVAYFFTNQWRQFQLRIRQGNASRGSLRSVALENVYNQLEDSYRPQPTELALTLISCSEEELTFSYPPDYGWSGIVPGGQFNQIVVSGDHLSMMKGEPLGQVLEAFRGCFES